MLPSILNLGLAAIIGVGFGIVIYLQQELILQHETQSVRNRREVPISNRRSITIKANKDNKTRRRQLEYQLNSGNVECVICMENVSYNERVWSCPNCWNIFHLYCISQWTSTESDTPGTMQRNCPVCRKNIDVNTLKYTCMCGRVESPSIISGVTPHCCCQPCSRGCGIPCHPGPCN